MADTDDPRVLALAQVIQELRPDWPEAHAYAHYYAHYYAYARAYAYAHANAHAYAHYYARTYAYAHYYARTYAYAPLTDEQKAHVDAAHALLFT